MDITSDLHVELAKWQDEIKNHLGVDSSGLVFEYREIDNMVKLDLITVNPRHHQSFLFHSESGYDKIDTLKKMLGYVKSYREKESPYTIQWMAKGDKELNTSYFRASGVYNALDKLYFGRDMNQITVFSVVLNPTT